MSARKKTILVVTPVTPDTIPIDGMTRPILSEKDLAADALDTFNHPRFRRALILKTLEGTTTEIDFEVPSINHHDDNDLKEIYADIHSFGLLEFLSSAYQRWEALGEEGRDPGSTLDLGQEEESVAKPLIPTNTPLPREAYQRPSSNVMGQIGYYCTDLCTPIMDCLLEELKMDASILQTAVERALENQQHSLVYAMPTHPGHHAARDSFGGYCYVNQAALAAKLFQEKQRQHGVVAKVAILDVDYHCGNGTAAIFYQDPTVLVVSLHCDPNFDYPFHSGYSDQTGEGDGEGTTLHLPMPPKTQWIEYEQQLAVGLEKICKFHADALVISMGLDTLKDDPCAIRRAGFCLEANDYTHMGTAIARVCKGIPTVVIQEGGYRMDAIGDAATNVLLAYHVESQRDT